MKTIIEIKIDEDNPKAMGLKTDLNIIEVLYYLSHCLTWQIGETKKELERLSNGEEASNEPTK